MTTKGRQIIMHSFIKHLQIVLLTAFLLFINPETGYAQKSGNNGIIRLNISSKESLLRIGMDPHPVSNNGQVAARMLFNALSSNNMDSVKKAGYFFETLYRDENKTGVFGSLGWLCKCIVSAEPELNELTGDKLAKDFFDHFTENNYANLKEYLQRKYKFNNFVPEDIKLNMQRRMYLEDMLMFNNPMRNDWENSDQIIREINIKPGNRVVDIGCGFGYYTYRFSKLVGTRGKVFAIDTEEPYVKYLRSFAAKYNIKNIIPIVSSTASLPEDQAADVVFMCSVYHIIYGWSIETVREPLISNLKHSLKRNGKLVIADNSYYNGKELNNCFLNKELVIAQLAFHGFTFEKYVQVTPQRYLLIFRHRPENLNNIVLGKVNSDPRFLLNVTSSNSVLHIGSLDSYDITESGIRAAGLALRALEGKDTTAARLAIASYNSIIPRENFGGEYTAIQWFCEYLVASAKERDSMLSDPLVRAYFNYLGKDDFSLLRHYIKSKYKLSSGVEKDTMSIEDDSEIGRTKRAFLEDFILFNNPKRESWEHSSKIMHYIPFKRGDKIADVGCGSGYFSYKFSPLVGDSGKIYAIDIKQEHLNFLNDFFREENIKNIKTITSRSDNICLNDKVDYAYMCSLYHIIYGVLSEPDRESFIESIKKSLKKDGRLIIVDNGPVNDETLPYHGPYISKELIIAQLAYYGFRLEKYEQIIPQRYILIFKADN